MYRRAYDYIGSRRFSVLLLKILAVYFVIMAAMRGVHAVPSFFYLVVLPLSLWGVFFVLNIALSFAVQRYAHDGNIIFHAAFLLAAIGVLLSSAYRFEGGVLMLDGDGFFGEESSYEWHNAGADFAAKAPKLSFTLADIDAEFWAEKLYFTGLTAKIEYPAYTRRNLGELRLNGGLMVDGTRLRLTDYGYSPYVLFEKEGMMVFRASVDMKVFPPGVEGVFKKEGYTLYVQVLPDPEMTPDGPRNKSVNITEPIFLVRIEWLGREISRATVPLGAKFGFGPYDLTFVKLDRYVRIGIVRDIGEPFIFAAFLAALGGLILRICGAFLHSQKPEQKDNM